MQIRDLAARLLVIEALVMFLVGERYVQIARQRPDVDVPQAMRRELRQWFDQLVDAPGTDPAAIERAAVRVIANVEGYVSQRLRG